MYNITIRNFGLGVTKTLFPVFLIVYSDHHVPRFWRQQRGTEHCILCWHVQVWHFYLLELKYFQLRHLEAWCFQLDTPISLELDIVFVRLQIGI